MNSTPDGSRRGLFIGAIELAMLDLLRQKIVKQANREKRLFVVDFPRLVEGHCIPPLHLELPQVTGLLGSPRPAATDKYDQKVINELAKRYPETLGLSEVLSRFIFEKSWSQQLPKLMLSTQTLEAGSIEDVLRRRAMEEWARTSSSEGVNRSLEQLTELELRPGRSIDQFVAAVTRKAKEVLPSIYGEYSQVRQLLRFDDVRPVAGEDCYDRPVIFAHAVDELRSHLSEIQHNKKAAQEFHDKELMWRKAIPETTRRNLPAETIERMRIRRHGDAKTLATIEYFNEHLTEYEVIFVTDDPKLYDGCLRRSNIVSDHRFNKKLSIGTADAFSRSRYAAYFLMSDWEHEIRKFPILDPRALMTGRDFVGFSAAAGGKERGERAVRAITEWLPVFFNGRERDPKEIARAYLRGQQVEFVGDETVIGEGNFDSLQYAALESHWKDYVRAVGTAHGLIRQSTRGHLREVLAGLAQGDRGAVEAAVHRQLDKVMNEWLPAVGGATLLADHNKRASVTRRGKERVRSVPPLLMPAWPIVQESIYELLRGPEADSRQEKGYSGLKWIKEPTAENLGLNKGDYKGADWKLSYLHSLGLAYLFATEGNWAASYRLGSIAFSLAEHRRERLLGDDETVLSGREAAFLTSLAARRSLASRPIFAQGPYIEGRLLGNLRNCVVLEAPMFESHDWQLRRETHDLRLQGEILSWKLYRQLCSVMRAEMREEFCIDINDFLSEYKADVFQMHRKIIEKLEMFEKEADCDAKDAYCLSLRYLGRQVLFNLLQVYFFSILACKRVASGENGTGGAMEEIVDLLKNMGSYARARWRNGNLELPWSCFENHVICKASELLLTEVGEEIRKDLGIDARQVSDGECTEVTPAMEYSLSAWRLEILSARTKGVGPS